MNRLGKFLRQQISEIKSISDIGASGTGGTFGYVPGMMFDPAYFGTSTGRSDVWQKRESVAAYSTISYVGECASILASYFAGLDVKFYLNGKELNDTPDVLKDKLYELVHRMTSSVALAGDIFVLLDSKNLYSRTSNIPDEFRVENPGNIKIYDSYGMQITSRINDCVYPIRYLFDSGYRTQWLEPEFVIHTKMPSPHNSARGMGVIEQNAPYLDADRILSSFFNKMFSNGIYSNLVITPEAGTEMLMTQDQEKEFTSEFMARQAGVDNFGKPIFSLRNPLKIQDLKAGFDHKAILESKKLTREDVFAFFGIPSIIGGNENAVKYDSAAEQIEVFNSYRAPVYKHPVEAALRKLCQELKVADDVRLIFPRRIDIKHVDKLFGIGAVSGNDVRKYALNLDEDIDPLANKYYTMINLVERGEIPMKEDIRVNDQQSGSPKPVKEKPLNEKD